MSTVGLLEEIQTLVCDRLQVVSYKWLSRNYSLPSDGAKRLLQEYVDMYGHGSKVIYALSGWLKSDPTSYKIQLVSGTNLEESKNEFEGNCSIQVYSVQASLPKDPATLWNTDFIQSEELYKQPATVINCLRDNRFGRIFNSSIQRTADGISVSISCHQSKDVFNNIIVPKTITSVSQHSKVPEARVDSSAQSFKLAENAKTANKLGRTLEHPTEKERHPQLASNKKKAQSDVANAPQKVNSASPIEEIKSSIPQSEARVKADKRSEFGGSDDEGDQVNVKRSSQKLRSHRRRVMLDSSDDDDENEAAVNLSSPDVPKQTSRSAQIQSTKTSNAMELKFDAGNDKAGRAMLHEEKNENKDSMGKNVSEASLKDMSIQVPETIVKRKANHSNPAPAPASPKRKKVLKTHIDERGREVTEVIWEGEDEKKKSVETSTVKKTDERKDQNTLSRPIGQNKKSPALGSSGPPNPSGKAGNKKTGNSKDPKQGNIMSFFKRV